MKIKIKIRSHRYDISKPRPRHGHRYSKKYLSIMMLILNTHHPSNNWGSIHQKVKQHSGWVEKTVLYGKLLQKKKAKLLKL